MKLVSIRDVLFNVEANPGGWFYLPPNMEEWTLDTLGVFSLDSRDFPPDSDEYLPVQAKENGWIETLDNGTIEEIVENAQIQSGNNLLSDEQLFAAFVFYVENDAFIDFS